MHRSLRGWMRRSALVSYVAMACIASVNAASAESGSWNVPGDMSEFAQACARPGLQTLCRNGYLTIANGYHALLLGDRIPIAPAPHVPWATPYARGPIKLLIISTFGAAPIEVEQLAQVTRALESDVRWVLVANEPVVQGEPSDALYLTQYLPEQARTALREDYDVILITFGTNTPGFGVAPAHGYFPDDIYRTILRKVQRGTGLVLVGQNSGGFWVDHTPLLDALPATMNGQHWSLQDSIIQPVETASFASLPSAPMLLYGWTLRPDTRVLAEVGGRPAVMTRDYGKGRVVLLGWDGTLGPQRLCLERAALEYDTAVALRAITFAAHKEPSVRMTVRNEPRSAGRASSVSVATNAAAKLEYSVRDGEFHTLISREVSARAGDNALALPALAKGRYQLDLIARDDRGRSLGWSSCALQVTDSLALGLKFDKEIYTVGETVHIHAEVTGSDHVPDLTVRWQVEDGAERVLARATSSLRGASPTLELAYLIRDARVAPHRVSVVAERQGAPLLQASADFFVPARGWDDYENVLWPRRPGSPLNQRLLEVGGFTSVLESGGEDEGGRLGARYGFRAARMEAAPLNPALVQTDPARAAVEADEILTRGIRAAQRYGALAWTFQDERHQASDPGMPNAETIRRYHNYLRTHYASLAALNASWHSQYQAWEQILPTLTPEAPHSLVQLAPWVDFRLYVADQAFEADKRHAQRVRSALGGDAYIGLDGFTSSAQALPYAGLDFGRLAAEGVFNFYVPYDDDLLLASLIKGPKAKYIGASLPRAEYFGGPWRDVFRGFWGTFRFYGPIFYSDFGWLQPGARWTGEGTRELRSGVGKLLMSSERELSPVVFLYSYPSLVAAAGARHALGGQHGAAQRDAMERSRGVLERLILGAGAAFGYQTDAQVAAGSLKGKRLLIMPASMGIALSRETSAAIQQFVNDGGIVLADIAPAARDEHGKRLKVGWLDQLFGITRERFALEQHARDYLAHTREPAALISPDEWYVDEWYEDTLRVSGGRALGEHVADATPAFIVKRTGKGQTLLLNLLLDSVLPGKPSPEENAYALMRSVLSAAGVEPFARVVSQASQPETHCEINRFADGDNRYFGVYAHAEPAGDPAQVQLRFDAKRPTYDVRAGRYLGEVDAVPLPLHAHEAALFARTNYRLTGLTLTAEGGERGEPVSIHAQLSATGPIGRHVVQVQVIEPDARTNTFVSRNIVLTQGRAELQFVPALNDPQGTWRVKAREVVSGLSAEASLEIE